METILDTIIKRKREELKAIKNSRPLDHLKEQIQASRFMSNHLYDALARKGGVNIIAEVKKGSPSKGIICKDFDPVRIARQYESCGASAISVLTDEHFFYGSLDYLKDIKCEVRLPVLRKDFIIDEYQIYEAKAYGADAILLIAAVLDRDTIERFLGITHELGMDALVEIHNKDELEKALSTSAGIIGINNRNLKDFSVDLSTTKDLVKVMSNGLMQKRVERTFRNGQDIIIVSESGIHTREDIDFILSAGVNSFLIGEALIKNGAIPGKMGELLSGCG